MFCLTTTSFFYQKEWENEISECGIRMKFVKLHKKVKFDIPCQSQSKNFVIEHHLKDQSVKLEFFKKNKELIKSIELSGESKKEISLAGYEKSFTVQISSVGSSGSVLIRPN
ncbi:hypothetical protein DD829_19675 [Chryseobacterium sp. HMWF035]|nr:hypothetical protein DBR25_15865 [Chryseobacterium sp. HMWF001]PVV52745.1 hypothetical protein DD829_19675 [Chryseobacterium sp. HMWF035]